MHFPRLAAAALSLAALALIVAGCGGSSSSSTGSTTASASGQPTKTTISAGGGSSGAVVSVASNPELGSILVNSEGLTLYGFAKDSGSTSSCSGKCAEVWPPLKTSGAPTAGEGAMASKLGTTKRSDGTMQVTYDGHPLYTYAADTSPGEANGNGISSFGAKWFALEASGTEAAASAPAEAEPESTTTESSGGGGYGY